MIFNLCPQNISVLDTVIEELDARFSEADQQKILQVIGDVLRQGDKALEGESNGHHGDTPMESVDVDSVIEVDGRT